MKASINKKDEEECKAYPSKMSLSEQKQNNLQTLLPSASDKIRTTSNVKPIEDRKEDSFDWLNNVDVDIGLDELEDFSDDEIKPKR